MTISGEIVRVRVLKIDRFPARPDKQAYYQEKEELLVENEGKQKYNLTRFKKRSEHQLVKGYVFQGEQVRSKNPEKFPTDTFERVEYIDGGFHGIASEDWPVPDAEAKSEHEILLALNSATHSAAPVVAAEAIAITLSNPDKRIIQFDHKWVEERTRYWTGFFLDLAETMVAEKVEEQNHDEPE